MTGAACLWKAHTHAHLWMRGVGVGTGVLASSMLATGEVELGVLFPDILPSSLPDTAWREVRTQADVFRCLSSPRETSLQSEIKISINMRMGI